MRKAALIYNPASGARRQQRLNDVAAAARVLREAGVDATAVATRAPGSGGEQAREAAAAGCDAVLACGGDGTVHDILQGLAGSEVTLGVIPLGTGNTLANDLGLSRDPARAAEQLLASAPRRIALGKIEYEDPGTGRPSVRYFTVIAGAGVDAQMLYRMSVLLKERHGMGAYYAAAARLLLTHRLALFEAEVTQQGQRRRLTVSQVLAVRIRQFGGVIRRLSPQAALERDDLALVLFKTRSRLLYLLYLLRGLLERSWRMPGVETLCAQEVLCRELTGERVAKIHAEADGELLGGLPVRISVAPEALTLLMPRK